MTAPLVHRRVAVSTTFGVNGLLSAMWVAHIPVVSQRTGVDHTTLGALLLVLGGCAFLGMQICGPLIDRWGSRDLTAAAAVVLSVATLGPVVAQQTWQLALALALFGVANGAIDVAMNSQAVVVEQAYTRPIMSSFHAYFSLGGVLGSGLAAAALLLDIPVVATVAVVAVIGATGALLARRSLVAGPPGRVAETSSGTDRAGRFPRGVRLRIAVLAVVAFALMLAEGTAYDWSALHLVERFGVTDAVGAIAFGAFSSTMLIGRFGADAITARRGPVTVVRVGAATAVVGMAVAICAPGPAVAIAGWAIFGIGVAGGVPQLFTAAGNVSSRSRGRIISTVVGCGYLGMLAGPAVIGPLSHQFSLGSALWLPAAAAALGCAAAGVVRPSREPSHSDAVADRAKLEA